MSKRGIYVSTDENEQLIAEYGEHQLNDINAMRRYLKMSPIEQKKRSCLCCGGKFMSTGNGQRMCARCRSYRQE